MHKFRFKSVSQRYKKGAISREDIQVGQESQEIYGSCYGTDLWIRSLREVVQFSHLNITVFLLQNYATTKNVFAWMEDIEKPGWIYVPAVKWLCSDTGSHHMKQWQNRHMSMSQ